MAWLGVVALLAMAGAFCRFAGRGSKGPGLRDVALVLELLLAGDLVSRAVTECCLAPARAAGLVPYVGFTRLAFHVTQLAFLAWPFVIAALAWRLFVRGWGWQMVAALLPVTAAVIAFWYPTLRGPELASVYRFVLLGALALALAGLSLPRRNHEHHASLPRPDVHVGQAHLISLLLLAGLTAELAGPYLADPFGSWWTAQVSWSLVLVAVSVTAVWGGPWRTAPVS